MALLALLFVTGCGAGRGPEPGPGATPNPERAPFPDPVQLTPLGGAERLTSDQVAFVVATARADPIVGTALGQGPVSEVRVRAASTGTPDGPPVGAVAFGFREPVDPRQVPWKVLCDIGGQTRQWRGVAARVILRTGEVESSPIWLTGANCVQWTEEE